MESKPSVGMVVWLAAVGYALAAGAGSAAAAGPPEVPREVTAASERTAAAARKMSQSALPDRTVLGADWKVPWEMPAGFIARAGSEDEYWKRLGNDLMPAGMSAAEAAKFVDALAASFAGAGGRGADQISERDALAMFLGRIRADDAPPVQRVAESMELMRGALEGAPPPAGPGADPDARARQQAAAQRRLVDAAVAPFKDMTAAQVKQALVKQLSLVQKRTEMTYARSNNWAELGRIGSERAAAEKGIWVGMVKVKVMVLDPARAGEMQDLAKADVAATEAKLAGSARAALAAMTKFRQAEAGARADAAKKEADEAAAALAAESDEFRRQQLAFTRDGAARRADQIRADAAKEADAFSRLAVKVEPRDFGDNSYVIRFTGVTPDQLGAQGSLYYGWLRKGNVVACVEVGGNFPEQFTTDTMNLFLKEVDARFISSDTGL